MTTMTIKTVLFASLIAAMILPFSTMNMAHAINEEVNIECEKKSHKICLNKLTNKIKRNTKK